MNHFENAPLSDYDWYSKARNKIESFLPQLDPQLEVEIAPVKVTPTDPDSGPYETLCLRFSSNADPALTWTMEIRKNDQYIEEELTNIVRDIYYEKRSHHNDGAPSRS